MSNTTHNQVRQVLMNELGLSRESIREEMRTIITDTIEKKIGQIDIQGIAERAVERVVRNTLAHECRAQITDEISRSLAAGFTLSLEAQMNQTK